MIDNFEIQPYPLYAVHVSTPDYHPFVCRVLGWTRQHTEDGQGIAPLLDFSSRLAVPREVDFVLYYDTRHEAEANKDAAVAEARQVVRNLSAGTA